MTTQRLMKKSYATALFVFGIMSVLGLGFLMYRVLDRITVQNPNVLFLLMFLFIGVSAALFLLGIFLGYFYRRPSSPTNKQVKNHYRKALEFERSEKSRLEQNLREAKKTIISLKDKVAQLDKESHQHDSTPPAANASQTKEIEALRARQDQLQNDLNQRKQRIADLQAEIAMAQAETADARLEIQQLKKSLEPQRLTLEVAKDDASLKDILEGITRLDGIHMALVADDYGLVVETSGSEYPAEKLAAVSSLLSQVGTSIDDIFEIGALQTVSIGDDRDFVLENYYFELFDLRCALTIARNKKNEYPGLAENTIGSIVERLDK